jgi:hypothetical protein
MRSRFFLSENLSELLNHLDISEEVQLVPSPVHVLQVHSQTGEIIHFLFEVLPSLDLQNYLKSNDGKKVLIFIKSKGNFKDLPVFLHKYGIDYFELTSFEEFKEVLHCFDQEIIGERDEEDVVMMQRKEETFKENQLWIKFLTCIPGVSIAKAQAIIKEYPSFTQLLLAYNRLPEETRGMMLKDIPTGSVKVGKVVSGKIYKYINSEDPQEIL